MPTFSQVLLQAYREVPDKTTLHLLHRQRPEHQPITYRRLLHGAAGYAQALKAAGIRPGEIVVLILNHSTHLVDAYFGAVLQGAVPSIMPFLTEKLAPEQYRTSLAALFEITAPSAVITYQGFLPELHQAAQNASSLRVILAAEAIEPADTVQPSALPGLQRSPEDIVLLQHSSGTTGLQKGVALSHHAVFNQIHSYGRAIKLDPVDVIVSWLPLYHDMGLIAGFLLPILTQTPLVLMSPFDWVRMPVMLLQAVSRYSGTLTWMPNFAFNFCAQKIRDRELEGIDLSSWRAAINCSEPMFWESHEMFRERFAAHGLRPAALATCYAMAENVFAVTQGGIEKPVTIDRIQRDGLIRSQVAYPTTPGSADTVKMLSAGRPIENTQVRILDERGQECPNRNIGEIAIRSDCLLTGYYNRPDLTAKAFVDGWYLTGDLGYQVDGEVYITGRKKDLIIVGGKNVYPQDLERLAGETPGVHPGRVAAFGVPNPRSGTEDVVIIAEAETGDPQERHEIGNEIRRRVTQGSDIALRFVQVVERNWLLKTSSGKVSRSANREKYLREFSG